MSLRDLFSRKNETHRRRKSRVATPALAARAETLEDRVLLSVESPLLTNHGVNFGNQHVLGRTDVTFFDVNNPKYSNNNGVTPGRGDGNGLNVVLDGAAPNGNLVLNELRVMAAPAADAAQAKSVTLSGGVADFAQDQFPAPPCGKLTSGSTT